MQTYAAIDLHSNNGVLAIIDETDRILKQRRIAKDKRMGSDPLPTVIGVGYIFLASLRAVVRMPLFAEKSSIPRRYSTRFPRSGRPADSLLDSPR
jgi:hypothetical protein